MIPTYRYSVSSPMPIDLNEDHTHQLFSTHHQASSSSSSLSYSILFNPDEDQGGSCYWESKHLQSDEELVEKIVPSSESWDHPAVKKGGKRSDQKLRVWKKEEYDKLQGEDSSVKWIPSERGMMVSSNLTGSDIASFSNSKQIKYEEKKAPLSPLGTDDSNNNYASNHSNISVRVCADCHTTKTPLWRSGPKGPKSLCNACGIRQRKARRATAAAASANGKFVMAVEKPHVKGNKMQGKGMKKSKTDQCAPQLKKKHKLGAKACRGRKRFGAFEDLTISLSKNLALQQVFPQDEKEAAILLMALSYGLLHGFPSDCYLDL